MSEVEKRFWSHVKKTKDCWLWIAADRGNGYGCFKFQNKIHNTHRVVWFLTYKKWPTQWILHKCNIRKCVNPSHLYEGTPKENYNDMVRAGNAWHPKAVFTKEEKILRQRIFTKNWYQKIRNDPDQTKYKKWRLTQKNTPH